MIYDPAETKNYGSLIFVEHLDCHEEEKDNEDYNDAKSILSYPPSSEKALFQFD
jgi:hypothetical protein